jgi:hypothetical protein
MAMQASGNQPFSVEELKQYFFSDRQPVEEFDTAAKRNQLEALLLLDLAP